MDNQRFAEQLKKLMEMQNLSKKDVAKHLDTSTSTVDSWLNGQKVPKWDKLFHLANLFHVSLAQLLGVDEL